MSANLSFAVVVVVVGLTRFLPCKSMSAESCFGTKDLFYTPAPTQPHRAKGERSHTHTLHRINAELRVELNKVFVHFEPFRKEYDAEFWTDLPV